MTPLDKITVVKRDGVRQPFSPDKIIQVAEAAGLEAQPSIQLASEVTQWIQGLDRPEVSSLEIRDKVQVRQIAGVVGRTVAA